MTKGYTNAASMAPPMVPDPSVKTVEEFLPKFGPDMTRSKRESPEMWWSPMLVHVDGVPAVIIIPTGYHQVRPNRQEIVGWMLSRLLRDCRRSL
jgi:hypothetical protein